MISMEAIQQLADRIGEEFHPEKVILFGSYAYGTPTEDSDVDLLVVLPYEGRASRKAAEIVLQTNPSFPTDMLVRSPEQLAQRLALNDFFLREVTEKGKVLYAAPN